MLETRTNIELKKLSDGLTLLYVEDNAVLRKKAVKLLKKLLTKVISASDGEEGYSLFKSHLPEIVISGMNMPKLNGLEMIKLIKQIQPSTKFIITSASDDKDFLLQSIDAGVFHYMKKPIKVKELTSTLIKCVETINREDNSSRLNIYMKDMLNYQNDLIALMSNDIPIYANQMFLDFFNVKTIKEFCDVHHDFGSLLLKHKGFLYNHDDVNWFSEASNNVDKHFHVKIADSKGSNKHLILKIHPIPNKNSTYIMSLNDITDLNLLSAFDSKEVKNNKKIESENQILNLMKIIKENNSEIKINNFYKGIRITNSGFISDINDDNITIKTTQVQQKATQQQKNILISSDIFPTVVFCKKIVKIDFDEQTIVVKDMSFLDQNPTKRTSVRVFPEENHTVSLFQYERKLFVEVRLYDVSVKSVKLKLNALPAGLKVDGLVVVNMVLEQDRKPTIIQSSAIVIRIDESNRSFFVVLELKLDDANRRTLINYVAKRQMNLIREFKGLDFG